MKKSTNTHFKSPTRGQAVCGLNASYDDRPTEPLSLKVKSPASFRKKYDGVFL